MTRDAAMSQEQEDQKNSEWWDRRKHLHREDLLIAWGMFVGLTLSALIQTIRTDNLSMIGLETVSFLIAITFVILQRRSIYDD